MGLHTNVLDPSLCHSLFVRQFCNRNYCQSVLLPCKETKFMPSFTVYSPWVFIWSLTCFIVVWALHICKICLFFLSIKTGAEQVDVFMKWMWHLSRWLRAEAESLNILYSMSIFAVVTVCISQLACNWVTGGNGNWNWGRPLTSEVVSQRTLDVI